MNKKLLTASAVVCTLGVLSMICLGQIKKSRSVSPLAAANVEALTEDENHGLWERIDEDCTYTFYGKAGSNVSFTI